MAKIPEVSKIQGYIGENLYAALEAIDSKLEELTRDYWDNTKPLVDQHEVSLNRSKTQIVNEVVKQATTSTKIRELEANLNTAMDKISEKERIITHLGKKRDEDQEYVKELQAEVNRLVKSRTEETDRLQTIINQQRQQIESQGNALSHLRTENDKLKTDNSSLFFENNSKDRRIKNIDSELKTQVMVNSDLQLVNKDLRQQLDKANAKLMQMREELDIYVSQNNR